ncbi:DHS-like NAD/FAD-binding domain-containing protein [Ganoderma leucocontextum]|nr:DHS-like NAD/FAD-binding domain-containing protein [Ganoderma leucocontextum]
MQQPSPSTLDKDIEAFRAVLARSKRIVVLAGAGLSAASRITTWRGNTGSLWRGHDFFKLSTKAAFIDDPSRIWQYNHYLRTMMLNASPNAAHEALARFAVPQSREKLAPHSAFTLITQNIDGLDRRAIDQAYNAVGLPSPLAVEEDSQSLASTDSAADPLLLEMHGHVAGVLCTDYECKHRTLNLATPICPALAGTERVTDVDANGEPEIAVPDLPRCARCGSLLRPDIVWFTEVPHRIAEVVRVVEGADVIMVVGTSAVVHPAATFAAKVKERGGTVAIFNVERSNRDGIADFVFLGPCEEILPKVLDLGGT